MLGQKRKVECEGEVVEKKPSIEMEDDGMDEWNEVCTYSYYKAL